MNSGHGPRHSELLALYAVQALPPEEARVAEARLGACLECQIEFRSLRPAIETHAAGPGDVLRPSRSLWERIERRLTRDTITVPILTEPSRETEPEWVEVAPGISCQILSTDGARDRVSMLVRLAPGTDYPPHRHHALEELYMLDGELIVDGKTFRPGDYRYARAGTIDRRVWTKTGCTCVLVTSAGDALL